ncbi:response regulator [Clostridium sp. CF012]|uniref:response regulator transcription factor n=1 Tax=Clostridium sp. CF012 TaxID=2843319 RepID=UPI001C0AB1A4|nr:response regulator [Clostridium sp. CF012]MBU3144835.1 response regulator [Clostridium sp. CF012]
MYKVLIIDDEEIIREGLKTVIAWETLGCSVIGEAADGDEGLEMLSSLQPDIVITDIRMPGLNGLEMISKLKEHKHGCKIIILSGFRDFEYAQQAVKLGAFRFLLKPTNTKELILSIEDAIIELKKVKSNEEIFKNLKRKVKEDYNSSDRVTITEDKSLNTNEKNSKYLVVKALSFMKANVNMSLTLKDVSDHLYISTWYLSKLIKKETGSTFIYTLSEMRIDEAKKLLLQPQYKIYEVSTMIGFTDVTYFNKLFKSITGLKPMEYRNKNFNDENIN